MPIINLEAKEVGCRKPECKRRMEPTARHHRRCETMFIRGFDHRDDLRKSKRYRKMCDRYDSFDPRDVVILCAWHHCEIHLIYDAIVQESRMRLLKPLTNFNWREADALMKELRKLCYKWEAEETPGADPIDCTPSKRFPNFKRGPDKRKCRRRKKHGRK